MSKQHAHKWIVLPDSLLNTNGDPTEYRCADKTCGILGNLKRNGRLSSTVRIGEFWVGPAGLGSNFNRMKPKIHRRSENLSAIELQHDLSPTTDYGKPKKD